MVTREVHSDSFPRGRAPSSGRQRVSHRALCVDSAAKEVVGLRVCDDENARRLLSCERRVPIGVLDATRVNEHFRGAPRSEKKDGQRYQMEFGRHACLPHRVATGEIGDQFHRSTGAQKPGTTDVGQPDQ
jgi:hypothetical protein